MSRLMALPQLLVYCILPAILILTMQILCKFYSVPMLHRSSCLPNAAYGSSRLDVSQDCHVNASDETAARSF